MNEELDKIVSDIKYFWEQWVDNACKASDLKYFGDSEWVSYHNQAILHKIDFGTAFDKLTKKIEEFADDIRINDILDDYDFLHAVGKYSPPYQKAYRGY